LRKIGRSDAVILRAVEIVRNFPPRKKSDKPNRARYIMGIHAVAGFGLRSSRAARRPAEAVNCPTLRNRNIDSRDQRQPVVLGSAYRPPSCRDTRRGSATSDHTWDTPARNKSDSTWWNLLPPDARPLIDRLLSESVRFCQLRHSSADNQMRNNRGIAGTAGHTKRADACSNGGLSGRFQSPIDGTQPLIGGW
jgi:hypothetical protein